MGFFSPSCASLGRRVALSVPSNLWRLSAMRNRPRVDRQGTPGKLCSPRRVRWNACTNPIIPAMTQPTVRTTDGAPPRRFVGRTRTLSARYRGITVIIGLGLQLLSCVQGMLPAWAQAGQAASELKRSDCQIRRFDEDWSVLRGVDRSKTDDFWDRFKFIPLTEDQNVWLSLGGQVRERLEYFGVTRRRSWTQSISRAASRTS
jgi:hypothetical protein